MDDLTGTEEAGEMGTEDESWRAMTVGDLVEVLEKYPPDTQVVVDGYEGGLTPLGERHVYSQQVALGFWTYQWWYGSAEPVTEWSDDEVRDGDVVWALVLSRSSPSYGSDVRRPHLDEREQT